MSRPPIMRIEGDFAERVIGEALGAGADEAELYIRTKEGKSAEAKGGAMESIKASHDFGYAVRVFKGSRTGFSYSTSGEDFRDVVASALAAAGHTAEDAFLGLPRLPLTVLQAEIYDPGVSAISSEEAVKKAVEIEEAALKSDPRIRFIRNAIASFYSEEVFLVNSNGVAGCYGATAVTAHIMAVAEEGRQTQVGWDFMGGRFLSDVSFSEVGRQAAGRALMMLGARTMTPMKAPVLIDRAIVAELLGVLASMLSAESAQKGKSLLKDRLGQQVINPNINIIDAGLLPRAMGGIATRPFDDEGVMAERKNLIEKGVLKGFMHNTYTASKAGARSTGNAVKHALSSSPSVGPLNLYLEPADGKRAGFGELLGMASKGFYVIEAMGMHTVNPVSGEFSVGVSGLMIEGGKLSDPVKEAVISGNILDLFGKIEAVGEDLRFYGSTGAPSLLFGPLEISA